MKWRRVHAQDFHPRRNKLLSQHARAVGPRSTPYYPEGTIGTKDGPDHSFTHSWRLHGQLSVTYSAGWHL